MGHDHDHDHPQTEAHGRDHAHHPSGPRASTHAHDHDHDHARSHGHGHAHARAHDHGHGHAHGPVDHGRAFAIGIALNVVFVVIEAVFGVLADSSALLADAAHNAGDVLGLALAWGAATLARRAPSALRTYGLRRTTVLAALANALLLVAAVAVVAWEAIGRFGSAVEPQGPTMMLAAAIGVVINGVSAMLFYRGSKGDANVRGAFLHLLTDAAVSAGVIVAGLAIWLTGATWVDPVTSLIVSAIVLWGTWDLLRDSLHLSLDGVPRGISIDKVHAYLLALPGVQAVHDLHVWAMSTTETALTAHLTMDCATYPPPFLADLEHRLEREFGIGHTTVQIEPVGAVPCARAEPGCL